MSAEVIALADRARVLNRQQLHDFLDQDTYHVNGGVAVWWGEGRELFVAAADRAVAALAADAIVRRQVGDSLFEVFGAVVVDEPISVKLLGTVGEKVTWERTVRPAGNTIVMCRVWAGEDGLQ